MEHFITAIHINHVRHLKDIDIPLSSEKRQHLILTGRNGSGKTSVLDALKLYLMLYPCNEYEMNFYSQFFSKNPPLINHRIIKNLTLPPVPNMMVSEDLLPDPLPRKTGILVDFSTSTSTLQSEINAGNFIIAYYDAEREFSAENIGYIENITLKDSYRIDEHPGQDFVKYLVSLKTKEALYRISNQNEKATEIEDWFRKIENTLRKIFSDPHLMLNFDIENLAFYISETGKEPFSFDTLASGYAAVLDIVADLIIRMGKNYRGRFDVPGIVLIDEVDAHLHLSLQKDILPLLTGLFPRIQFIVTTHSPFVLGSAENTVIYDLEKNLRISGDEGLSNLTYSGIVEGYFGSSELSNNLECMYQNFLELSRKESLSQTDYEKLGELITYLDAVPSFLTLRIAVDYKAKKMELLQRLKARVHNDKI
jgi:hypothetical protein